MAAVTAPDNNGKNTGTGKGRPPAATRFKAGNPGRPRGSRNRVTALLDVLADGDLEAIYSKIIGMAKGGDLVAAKMVLDRVAPAPRARAVEIDLATFGKHDGAEAIIKSLAAIVHAVASGEVSPAEGLELAALVDKQRQAIAELRPDGMGKAPTSEQLELRRRAAERGVELERQSEALIERLMNGK
jgi:hypothetical protein